MRARLLSQLAIPVLLLLAAGCDAADPLGSELLAFRRTESPSGTSVVVVAYNRMDVSWQDNSGNESGFELQRAPAVAGPFAVITNTTAGVTSYSDWGLSASTQYCYRVRAVRTTGKRTTYSDFSNVACGTTSPLPLPAAPSSANAIPLSSTTVQLTWADNSNDETSFRIEFSLDGGGTWQWIGQDQPANATSLFHYGRTPDQLVCYRVIAVGLGNSPPSNVDCTAPPEAPTSLSATGVDGGSIDLRWNDNSSVEDGYEVWQVLVYYQCDYYYYYCYPYTYYSWLANVPAGEGEITFRHSGLDTSTFYSYVVVARKDGGNSDVSNEAGSYPGPVNP